MFNTRLRRFCLVLLPALCPAAFGGDELDLQYRQALERVEEAHNRRWEGLLTQYRGLLDRLIAEAQPRGDIETIAVLLDEREDPGSQPPPPPLELHRAALDRELSRMNESHRAERRSLAEIYLRQLERRVADLTRAGDIAGAVELADRARDVRAEVEGRPAAAANLGPNLFPDGAFDQSRDQDWEMRFPRGNRNRSGIHIDTRPDTSRERNRVLRIQQDAAQILLFARNVPLEAGKSYRVTWRSAMARPWRSGAELRGKGHYSVGFQIPRDVVNALPPDEQMLIQRRVRSGAELPASSAWQTQEAVLEAGPHMRQLFIEVSAGEGEFLIDDLEIRELLSTPQPQEFPF